MPDSHNFVPGKQRFNPLMLLAVVAVVFGSFYYLYIRGERKEREEREDLLQRQSALMKSVNASVDARKPFTDRAWLIDKYVDSLVEEDASAKTWGFALGVRKQDMPTHPLILRRPYPTIAQVEQSIGIADSTESHENPNRPYPIACVLPIYIWHMNDPACLEKTTGSSNAGSSCDRMLLTAAFGKDGRLCYVEHYRHGTEDIGRNWGSWSLDIHGNGDQRPVFP